MEGNNNTLKLIIRGMILLAITGGVAFLAKIAGFTQVLICGENLLKANESEVF